MKPRFDNRTFALATPAGIPRSSFRRDDDEVHGDSAKRELKGTTSVFRQAFLTHLLMSLSWRTQI